MSHEYSPPPGSTFGVVYPTQHVLAVLPDLERAEAVRQVLLAAGYPTEVYAGDWVVANHAEFLKRRSVGQRLGGMVAQDETEAMNSYVEAARNGEAIAVIQTQAGREAELDEVRSSLVKQGGHLMRYYGKDYIRDLPSDASATT